uniref:Uncharacterized protein n=1 Tax=Anguilla anguilla TaxID=7936 RepID=A0A0E9Q0U1_ANGAN
MFMSTQCPSQTLDISFKVKYENGYYGMFASSSSMRCFECGDFGH